MAKKKAPKKKAAPKPDAWLVLPFPADRRPVSAEFAEAIQRLEKSLKLPVWLLVQDGDDDELDSISRTAKDAFFSARGLGLEAGKKVAVVIDSFGGSARGAYEIATLLRKHCGGFTAVIPRRAKSAATLLALGADEIVLGEYGELGPLDVQYPDPEREERISGLDEVQALERLNAFVMSAFDQTMFMLIQRTGMKVATLIPHVSRFVNNMAEPMFRNIDVVRYTQMSRALKVGEEYACRLLRKRLGPRANEVARRLVENYPEHGFIIDFEEAKSLGLKPTPVSDDQFRILKDIAACSDGLTAIGRLEPVTKP